MQLQYLIPPHFQFLLKPDNWKLHSISLSGWLAPCKWIVWPDVCCKFFMHGLNAPIRPVAHYSMNYIHHPCWKITWLLVCEIERLKQGSTNWNGTLLSTVKTLPGWEIAQFHLWKLARKSCPLPYSVKTLNSTLKIAAVSPNLKLYVLLCHKFTLHSCLHE